MHYLKGLISSMQGHGQVNVPNIIIDCNPCSSAKKTRWCQTAATADKNRQEYSRQDSEYAIRTKAKQFCEKLMRFISKKDEESISTPMMEQASEE